MNRLKLTWCLLLCINYLAAQQPIPLIKKEKNKYSFIVDGKPFIVLGAQLWNGSAWPFILEKEWPQLRELGCNTIEAPVYWQNIEPVEGQFNFSELDTLIAGARANNLRLIVLWFASFKNGSSQYPPEWVQMQPGKYARVHNAAGDEMNILSTLSRANLEADKKAFMELMRHIKKVDESERTVIMVQVQNEAGYLYTDRDYSDEANKLFSSGKWASRFGPKAAETFSATYLARYINEIAAAGKEEYNLPMYVNAWPQEHGFQRPGEYPSGGPVSSMLDLWKKEAPAIDLIAPDIYLGNYSMFNELLQKYHRADNPVFIPETGKGTDFARNHFYAIGNYDAIGVAPYGIDPFHADPNDKRDKEKLDEKFFSIRDNYKLLRGAIPVITKLQGTGKLKAVGEDYGLKEQLVSMGNYDILFSYGFPSYVQNRALTGRALIGQLNDDEFILVGFDAKFVFKPRYGSGYGNAEIIVCEEGYYLPDGTWIRKRIWNGDEIWHSTLLPDGVILKIKLRRVKGNNSAKGKANFE